MAQTLKFKRGLDTNFASQTLEAGEPAFILDTGKLYIGDGTNKILINPDLANAVTASRLQNSRIIGVSGDGSGSVSFDGSSDATITLVLASTGVSAGTYTKVTVDAKGRITSATNLSSSDIPTLTLSKISDAGTAASKNTGTLSGNVPVLDSNGKLDTSVLPALAITDVFVVASQTAMLALSAEVGDVAVRTDLNKSYILKTAGASTLANWQELLTPTDSVTSVSGKTGAVTLTSSDVGLGNVTNESKSTMFSSPTFTGTPVAPTASADTSTTQLATTAFVIGQAGSLTPTSNGTASVGTSKKYSREDHVHPSDSTKASLVQPVPFVTTSGTDGIAYTASFTGITLTAGAQLILKINITNTNTAPTLNVNSLGAKTIVLNGGAITAGMLPVNSIIPVIYDGTYWQIQSLDTSFAFTYTTASAVANTYTLTYPGYSLISGLTIPVKFNSANTSTTPTLNINGLGAKTIQRNGSAVAVGEIGTNIIGYVTYDGTNYQLFGIEDIGLNILLTGYTKTGSGAIADTDTVNAAFGKIENNLDLKSPLNSPALTGTPTAPTATAGTNTTQIATTSFVTTAVANKTTITGNANTATTLQTARTIALSGGVTGTATSFNGSANITIPITSVDTTYLNGTIDGGTF